MLDARKGKILGSLIESYVENAVPVGSRSLSEHCDLKLSPSTLRNEMGALEELGFITHLHTSAGRIPTDQGYRYYVDHLAERVELNPHRLEVVIKEYQNKFRNTEEFFERSLKVLSSLSHQASLLFIPEFDDFILEDVKLFQLENNSLLVVWLSIEGATRSYTVDMGERLTDEEMGQLSRFLNQSLKGLSYSEIQHACIREIEKHRDSLRRLSEKACHIIEHCQTNEKSERVRFEGSLNILEQPEFQSVDKVRVIFNGLAMENKIQELLQKDLCSQGVRVRIGVETEDESFNDCAIISASYSLGHQRKGVIGVLGPKRIHYGEMMSLVSRVAEVMGESFGRWPL